MIRPSRKLAEKAAIALTPEYVSLLRDFQKHGSQIKFTAELAGIHAQVGHYVTLYEDELHIGVALFLALMGEEGFAKWNREIELASEDEKQKWLNEVATAQESDLEAKLDEFRIPETTAEWAEGKAYFASLKDSEKVEAVKRANFFWSFWFGGFFNTVSLMVHGVKLTTLVPQAIAGDTEAFFKSVQIDRMLLIHHSFFRERKRAAQEQGETAFLKKLLTTEIRPPLRSKIRYPALYMLFGILDAYQWLDDMKHEEILNIVDAAGLDRYQNRVEDVNHLTKRLLEYRRWQR